MTLWRVERWRSFGPGQGGTWVQVADKESEQGARALLAEMYRQKQAGRATREAPVGEWWRMWTSRGTPLSRERYLPEG